MRRPPFKLVVLIVLGWALLGCGSDEKGPEQLMAALQEASEGDVIRIGPGMVTGTFEVPAGVRIEGAGVGQTVIVGPTDRPAIVLGPGAALGDLSVVADGGFAVVGRSADQVSLTRVEVRVQRGIGLGFEASTGVELQSVSVLGPVTLENATSEPSQPSTATTATHGLVFLHVVDARLVDVRVSGFSAFGALSIESGLTWNGGGTDHVLGTGIMVSGGRATLSGARYTDGLQGLRLIPSYGAVFTGGAEVTTSGVEVSAIRGPAILQAAGSTVHENLVVRDNFETGLWVQSAGRVTVGGTSSVIADNRLAGVVALESTAVDLSEVVISGTELLPRVVLEAGAIMVGDGVQVVGTGGGVSLRNVALMNNARVGVLLDLAGSSTAGLVLENVTVEGEGEQLGVVAQGGELLDGWDRGVVREGAPVLNDDALRGALDVLSAVSPTDIPMPADLADRGLGAFGAVSPTD